ncbi:N-acetylneuraminate synthase family protein [bacterium]|nr:N-acetylneuraminate synthase family protein [bacterium]
MKNDFIKKEFYLIAEIGVNYYDIAVKNHLSALDAAKLMIKKAHESGSHAVKFQSYKAETLVTKNAESYWDTKEESTTSQFELFKKFDKFSKDEFKELASYCNEIGIDFLSTPFDFSSVDYLDPLMKYYKISSSDITNIPFIRYIAKKNKPVLLSTGASTIDEIKMAVKAIEDEGCYNICIMHCILEYPTPYEDSNLLMIQDIKDNFPEHILGYSDHTKPDKNMDVLSTAFILGAKVIEKHFTLDKTLKGNDHYHAMDPEDIKTLRKRIAFITKILGKDKKSYLKNEENSRKLARRSIVSKGSIKKGEIITIEMITFKRPGTGIPPYELDKLFGRKAKIDIKEDTTLLWEFFE